MTFRKSGKTESAKQPIQTQKTKAGYPGRKFRIPAHVLVQLGVRARASCPSLSWQQSSEPQPEH